MGNVNTLFIKRTDFKYSMFYCVPGNGLNEVTGLFLDIIGPNVVCVPWNDVHYCGIIFIRGVNVRG